jgi:hypothetical protein
MRDAWIVKDGSQFQPVVVRIAGTPSQGMPGINEHALGFVVNGADTRSLAMRIYLPGLPVKSITDANTKNGMNTNNMPIQVINMMKPPEQLRGPCRSRASNYVHRCGWIIYHIVIYYPTADIRRLPSIGRQKDWMPLWMENIS